MNTKILQRIGKQIKYLRNRVNMTQEVLAEKIGVHQTYIGKIESGKSNPSALLLYRISRALGVELKELFDFE